jgi:pimeloyl-ACP methyl ester carboxylesterase
MMLDYDFEAKEVSWLVDNMAVYGTLTKPVANEACPGVVFVAGSGPTDRDWCSPLLPGRNGSARLLAESLGRQGYTTLRYDKRASGPHAPENMRRMMGRVSMQSHVDELHGAVGTLASAPGVDAARLFALTSSEGAIHALNYQLQGGGRLKGLVLTGVPGRSIGQVARSQILEQLSPVLDGDTMMKHYDEAISSFAEGRAIVPDPSLPEGLRNLLLGLTNPANMPFTRELWSYSPADAIARLAEPILVIIGKKDVQVDWQVDGKALEAAAAGKGNATFVYPENADHVLKHEEESRDKLSAEAGLRYNANGRLLDRETVTTIVNWLNKRRS